jgi:SagB-type dehydrogenase family enzyme
MILSAFEYHRQTSYDRRRMTGQAMDWENQPDVFKNYHGLDIIPLAEITEWPSENLSDLLSWRQLPDPGLEFDLAQLSRVVFLTHALTAKAKYGGIQYYFRSVASAGALYPFELYVGALDVAGLRPGLYHQRVESQALVRLRSGSILPDLSKGLRLEGPPPVLAFFLTAIFFRSSWKYRDRSYRYDLLDTGHLAENLVLALASTRAAFKFFYDFGDAQFNDLLGLDVDREVCLACFVVWGKNRLEHEPLPALEQATQYLKLASRCAKAETDYPKVREIHSSSAAAPKKADTRPSMLEHLGVTREPGLRIPTPVQWPEKMTHAAAVFSRRSSRNFVRAELPADQFSALLKILCFQGASSRGRSEAWDGSVAVGFLAGKIEGIEPGFYLLDRENELIYPVSQSPQMEKIANACLDQMWLANCSLSILFLTNFDLLEQIWGARGYRYAMMTAGRLGQRLYVGATSMRLGCCGIGAFYDDEVVELLGLNEQSRLLYTVAVGPIKKWSNV